MLLSLVSLYAVVIEHQAPFASINIVTLLLALFGGFLAFSARGLIINIRMKETKTYSRIYGIRFGKWVSVEGYPNISVLSKRFSSSMTSRSNLTMSLGSEVFYEVYLLDKTHRLKHFIQSYEDVNMANKNMNIIASKLGVNPVKYSPVISQKTKDRIKNRR